MKTGIKRLIALLCALLIVLGLVGCGKNKGLCRADFWENFAQILEPIADDYEIVKMEPVKFEHGETAETWVLTNKLLGDVFRVRVECESGDRVGVVFVLGERKEYGNFNFAVLCLYAYKAMGLEVADADAFYEEFNLLEEMPNKIKYDDSDIFVATVSTEENLSFTIGYKTQNAPE